MKNNNDCINSENNDNPYGCWSKCKLNSLKENTEAESIRKRYYELYHRGDYPKSSVCIFENDNLIDCSFYKTTRKE